MFTHAKKAGWKGVIPLKRHGDQVRWERESLDAEIRTDFFFLFVFFIFKGT